MIPHFLAPHLQLASALTAVEALRTIQEALRDDHGATTTTTTTLGLDLDLDPTRQQQQQQQQPLLLPVPVPVPDRSRPFSQLPDVRGGAGGGGGGSFVSTAGGGQYGGAAQQYGQYGNLGGASTPLIQHQQHRLQGFADCTASGSGALAAASAPRTAPSSLSGFGPPPT